MSPEYLDSRAIAPTNNIYERLEEIRREIDGEIMRETGEAGSPITYLQTGGDSLGYGLDVRVDSEAALNEAAGRGFLQKIANVSFAAVSKRLQLEEDAQIKLCFNSDEYVHAHGDAFGRHHNGDWRTDFVIVADAKGNLLNHA